MPILFFIVLIDLVGFGLVIPLLPFYAVRFGATAPEVTWLLATYSLMQLVAAPLWGRLSDRAGRRPVLMASMAASALAYLWLGAANTLWMLFAARALAGACAGNIAAAQAYIADITKPEDRAHGMGMIGAAFGLGFIIGPAVGGLLAGNNPATADLATPAWVAAGLSFAALCGVLAVLRESHPPERRGQATPQGRIGLILGALRRPVLSQLIAVFFLVILAFAAMESIFALWALRQLDWGPEKVGFVFAYLGLLSAVMQGGLTRRLTKRYGEERLLLCGLVLLAIGLVVVPFSRSLGVLGGAFAVLAIGLGLVQPALNSLISRRAGSGEQGQVLGVTQSTGSLARVVGPPSAGYLFADLGHSSPFLWGAAIVVIAFVLALNLFRGVGAAPLAEAEPPLGPAR
ncbi:MAG TPA: MFS transporter [Stellaceae bacterium]|jgi:DHA1 family tetracycline resistance protein-like MFS transporter|nr:MFS transporter [Stellaceae bacterium]